MSEAHSASPQLPPAPPQWSSDGQFWWTGEQWIPASALPPATSSATVPQQPAASGAAMHAPQPTAATAHSAQPPAAEQTLLVAQRHMLFYMAGPAIVGFLTLCVLVGFSVSPSVGSAFASLFFGAATFGTYRLAQRARAQTRIFITDRRVGFTLGILHKRSFELLMPKVESIATRRDPLARALGYGTLVIGGTGGSKEVLLGLVDAERFVAVAQQAIHSAQTRVTAF